MKDIAGQLQNIFSYTPAAIALVDGVSQKYILANPLYQKLFSRSEEQLLGKTIKEAFPEMEGHEFLKIVDNVYKTGQPFVSHEFPATFNAGTASKTGYYDFVVQPIKNDDGSVASLMIHAFEVTGQVEIRKQIEENEKNFRKLFMSIDEGFCILEKLDTRPGEPLNFKYIVANPAFESETGVGDIVGKTIRSAFPGESEEWYKTYDAILRTGEPKRFERALATQGRVLELYAFRLEDETNKRLGVIFKDITERKRIQEVIHESERHFRSILEGLPQLAWTSDPQGMHIYFNSRWYEFTGQTQNEARDEGWLDVVHPEDRGWVDSLWKKTLAKKTPAEAEYRMRDKDGIYHWFLSRAEPLFDAKHNLQSYIGTCTNIDEVKKVQQDLALARQRMEDFIKMASHELKTPLATLKGYLQLVLRGIKDEERAPSPLLIKSSAVNMEKQVNRLTRLVAELLDISRIEAGQLELNKELFSLNELVIEMVQDMLYIDNRVSIHVSHDLECQVYADKDRIGQVLTNLLTNAIKYSPGNKKIEVTIRCNNDNKAAVSVKDRGIGISKEEQQKIFQRFYRAEVFGKPYPGFGIGLYIANEIIHRHGGNIFVESEKGKGASFTFTLPIDNKNSLPHN